MFAVVTFFTSEGAETAVKELNTHNFEGLFKHIFYIIDLYLNLLRTFWVNLNKYNKTKTVYLEIKIN